MDSKILYHVHKSLPMDTNLHETNPVHKIHFSIILHLYLSFQSGHFLPAILTVFYTCLTSYTVLHAHSQYLKNSTRYEVPVT